MNKIGCYYRLDLNILLNQAKSKDYTALVDVLVLVHYNEIMEHYVVEDYICSEKAVPKRRILRSDVSLYVALLVAAIGIIMAGNALSVQLNLPRFFVELTLYAILFIMGYLVYRYCLTVYCYTLTSRMLGIDRMVGKKIRADEYVHLSDIISIHPVEEAGELGKCRALYTGKKSNAMAVTVSAAGRRYTILMSPSDDFAGKLVQQWKTERK